MVKKSDLEKEIAEYEALIQRSLVVFKPDAVQRGIVGELITRFERVGLKIVGAKMVLPDRDHYYTHYEEIGKMISRRGEAAFNDVLSYITQGPVIAMVFEGVEAVDVIRKIVGSTEPKSADMGTIRGDYSHVSFGYTTRKRIGVANLIHASGNTEEAKKEIKHWFKSEELYEYEDLIDKFTR
jgi:Nucleoside diphosphate kinase